MAQYCIVAARPKNAINHLNSQFELYRFDTKTDQWEHVGWRTTFEVSDLLQAGHAVRTGKIDHDKISIGAAVEIELRIAKNDTKYKISEMPE